MSITISVIEADIGSIGGSIAPSRRLIDGVTHTGDDVAGPAMLPMGEIESTRVMKELEALDKRFKRFKIRV